MNKIYFFETDKDEAALVPKELKCVKTIKEPFNAKNASKFKDAIVLCGMIDSDFSAKNLSKCPNLKMIAMRTVGYDNVDLKYAAKHEIIVSNVPDYGSHVIAEHVFALLLSSLRHVFEGEERTSKCQFSWKGLCGTALKGKTLGIIGTGKIGMNVCRIASLGFLMNVLAYDKYPDHKKEREYRFKYVKSLDEIWKKSDIISLHVPLFPDTTHLINAKTIAKMKDGVSLINTARGGLIDTKALIKAIKTKKFGEVALDVVEHEKNIKEDKAILKLPGVIITPHISFYADDSIKCMYSEAIACIKCFLAGKPVKNQVRGR